MSCSIELSTKKVLYFRGQVAVFSTSCCCFNSHNNVPQVAQRNVSMNALTRHRNPSIISRVATVRKKYLENEIFSRSGKSQGILWLAMEIWKGLGTQCIFDFEIHKKQMFTEARAFSRVTYFLFSGEPAGFFLKLT